MVCITMTLKWLTLILMFSIFISKVYACILNKQGIGSRPEKTKPKDAKPQQERPSRKLYYKGDHPACRCGTFDPSYPSWYLMQINAPISEQSKLQPCMATPIASNMLLTSHRCLFVASGKPYPYEAWNISHAKKHTVSSGDVIANPAPILHWIKQNPNDPSDPIPVPKIRVKDIVFHPNFYQPSLIKPPDEDVAIVVTEENWFDLGYNSVCLPKPRKDLTPSSAVYRLGSYIGAGGVLRDDPTGETRIVDNVVIMKAADCEKEGQFGIKHQDDTLCIRFRDPAPTIEGGSLSVYGRGLSPSLYVVGIASVVGLNISGTGINYAYFTNLMPHLSYIEEVAEKHGSLWCEAAPQFMPPAPVPVNERAIQKHPWETPSRVPARDESLNCVCGLPSEKFKKPGARISGGEEATPLEFPWMIRLNVNPMGLSWSQCGASIINDRMILTAAHCVMTMHPQTRQNVPIEAKDIFPHFGVHTHADIGQANFLKPDSVYIYDDYYVGLTKPFPVLDFDIAVIILKEPLKFSESTNINDGPVLRPICLPKRDEVITLNHKKAIISGWGLTQPQDENGKPSPVLNKIELPIQPLEDCAALTSEVLTRNMICATTYSAHQSALQGDSGGPLFLSIREDRRLQIGLTSFGLEHIKQEHRGKHLVFFTDVQRFIPFIDYFAATTGAKWCRSS